MNIDRDEKIDWFRIIVDIEREGFSHRSMAKIIGVGKRTIGDWRNLGARPRWEEGEMLLVLWQQATKNGRESAHRVKRNSHMA